MRAALATFCLVLLLAGCQAPTGGLFGQTRIPSPGTQPPGALLADNSYYPSSNARLGRTSVQPITPSLATQPSAPSSENFAPSRPASTLDPGERRAVALTRSSPSSFSRSLTPGVREEPIRIPESATSSNALAAVVPIHGIPLTDATTLFQAVRTGLGAAENAAPRAAPASDYVEISQLPDAPDALRRAALAGQRIR